MSENAILENVIILAKLALPFLALVSINTQYFKELFNWQGNASKLAASVIGLILGALVALYFFLPGSAVYVAVFLFLDLCWVGPSGGFDIIKEFANRVSGKPEDNIPG